MNYKMKKILLLLAIVFLAIGSVGVLAATWLEFTRGKAIWELMMKIFPWLFGIGGILFGIAQVLPG